MQKYIDLQNKPAQFQDPGNGNGLRFESRKLWPFYLQNLTGRGVCGHRAPTVL